MNILHISPNFNYSCGVSKHVFLLLKRLSNDKEINLFFATNGGDSLERLSKLNVKTSLLNYYNGKINFINFLYNLNNLKNYCIENKINIIHTHHRYPELLSVILARLLKIKTVATVHSFVDGWEKISFRSDMIIAVSKAVEKYLVGAYKVDKSKIARMYNYIEPFEIFNKEKIASKKSELRINDNEKILLFIGRIGYDKGFDILIKAFNRISTDNAKLIVVGNTEVEELSDHFQNDKSIIYFRPKENIYELINIADIIILPSRVDPFPYVMLEAGFAKKTFIGGRTGGIEEFIEDGVDGILVTPGNVKELADSLIYVIENPDKANEMGKNLSRKVNSLNTEAEYCDNLLIIYKELLFGKSTKV